MIAKFVHMICQYKANFTLKMMIDLLKGRKVNSAYGVQQQLTDTWSGQLK
jgi:hypothetical protein